MAEFQTVAPASSLPPGSAGSFVVEGRMVAVFNVGGDYYAIDDHCPHQGASLGAGRLDCSDATVTCPWHAWRFRVTDGKWADNPRLGVDRFSVRVLDGQVQVSLAPPENPIETGPA